MDMELHLSTCKKLLEQGEYALLEDIHLLKTSPLFNPDEYLATYPSIKEAAVDPYYHYCLYGWRDNLRPSALFSADQYLAANPGLGDELSKCQMSPLLHYLRYGRNEARKTRVATVCDNVAREITRLTGENHEVPQEGKKPAVKVADLLAREFRDLQPIPFFTGKSVHRSRLVFVTDALGASLLGGVGTALILASKYAVDASKDLLIVTRQNVANTEGYFSFMKMMREKVPENVSFYSDCERDESGELDFRLEVFDDDEFFTTSWWSTRAVKNMNLPNPIFYIIQEVEQFFYPYCDNRLFCSQLKYESGIKYIVNSKYLWDYFKEHYPHVTSKGCYFDPAFPPFLYHAGERKQGDRRKLFFYSRKVHQRNLFFTGLRALDLAVAKKIIDPAKWDIVFAGEEGLETVEFTDGTRPTYLGQMTWPEYAEFLSTVDLTFSLMYTPHPSYPPFDTMASGGVCVTNSFANKSVSLFGGNMILCELTDDALCDGLKRGVALATDDETRRKNHSASKLPVDWSSSLASVISFMKGRGNA